MAVTPIDGRLKVTRRATLASGVHPDLAADDLVHQLCFELASRGIVLARNSIEIKYTEDAVVIVARYNTPTLQQNQIRRAAIALGWENGSAIRLYEREGSPDEIRSIPDLLLSPYRPGLVHKDPAMAVVLDLAWIRGLNAGRRGQVCPK